MSTVLCGECGATTVEGRGDYLELSGPEVAIHDVPALLCPDCGACCLPPPVLRRLAVIVDAALDLAGSKGLREVRWAYTSSGPAELGALPLRLREFFSGLRQHLARERSLATATERASLETPSSFH
jgi:YgiT-type zinc finger domain-containing protein